MSSRRVAGAVARPAGVTAPGVPVGRAGRLLLVMCAGMFLVLLDVTVVNVAVPACSSRHGRARGVGAALLLPSSLAAIADAYPAAADRARALGIWGALLGAAVPDPAGPPAGHRGHGPGHHRLPRPSTR
jgi:hypothetical protein